MTSAISLILTLSILAAAPFYMVIHAPTNWRFKLLLGSIPAMALLLLFVWLSALQHQRDARSYRSCTRQLRASAATPELTETLQHWLETPAAPVVDLQRQLERLSQNPPKTDNIPKNSSHHTP